MVIVAALFLGVGAIGITTMGAKGSTSIGKAWNKVDGLNVFGESTSAEFVSLTANGEPGVSTTTSLTLTLDSDIDLLAESIMLTGASIGEFIDNNDGTYVITLSDITVKDTEEITLNISKGGYAFDVSSKSVAISVVNNVSFISMVANGVDGTAATNKLTLTLDKDVDLTLDDVTLVGADKVSIADLNDGTYELSVTNVAPTVSVSLSRYGLVFDTSSKTSTAFTTQANPLTDFTMVKNATNDGWKITVYLNATDKSVVIPKINTNDGLPITEIGGSVFLNKQLTSVELPNSLKIIGNSAFGTNKLTTLTIPDSVTTLGTYVFNNNPLLTSVTLSKKLTTIPLYAFASAALTTIDLPNGITLIDGSAFYANKLAELTLPNTLTIIASDAFGSNLLTSVTIPNSVTLIGSSAFKNNLLTSLSMPSGFVSVSAGAFNKNQLPLSQSLFYSDSAKTRITSYGGYNQNVVIPSGVTAIASNAFKDTTLSSISLPGTLTTLEQYAFSYSTIPSVVIPNNVTSIGTFAFSDSNIGSVTWPSSVTAIGANTFSRSKLTSITLPSNLVTIGNNAFIDSTMLTSVTIPASLTTLGGSSFYGCTSLSSVRFNGSALASVDKNTKVFSITALGAGSISVPSASLATFQGWSSYFAVDSTAFIGY